MILYSEWDSCHYYTYSQHLGLSGILQSVLYILRAIRENSRLCYHNWIRWEKKTFDCRCVVSFCTRYARCKNKTTTHTTCLISLKPVLLPFTREMPYIWKKIITYAATVIVIIIILHPCCWKKIKKQTFGSCTFSVCDSRRISDFSLSPVNRSLSTSSLHRYVLLWVRVTCSSLSSFVAYTLNMDIYTYTYTFVSTATTRGRGIQVHTAHDLENINITITTLRIARFLAVVCFKRRRATATKVACSYRTYGRVHVLLFIIPDI